MQSIPTYKSCNYFGEISLLSDFIPKDATVITVTDCHFATLSKSDFKKHLQRVESRKLLNYIEYFEDLHFF